MSGSVTVSPDVLKAYFDSLLAQVDLNKDEFVEASEAVPLFRRSGLTNDVLAVIWTTAAAGQPRLSRNQFYYALGLIALGQNGKPTTITELQSNRGLVPKFEGIPMPGAPAAALAPALAPAPVTTTAMAAPSLLSPTAAIPVATPQAATGAPLPAASVVVVAPIVLEKQPVAATPAPAPAPVAAPAAAAHTDANLPQMAVTAEQKQHYQKVFGAIDTDGDGLINGAQAKDVFTKSGLPVADLGSIWGLSDVNKDGNLDFAEFSIAFFLIQWRLAQKDLPATVPQSLLASVGLAAPAAAVAPVTVSPAVTAAPTPAAAAPVVAVAPAPAPAPAPVLEAAPAATNYRVAPVSNIPSTSAFSLLDNPPTVTSMTPQPAAAVSLSAAAPVPAVAPVTAQSLALAPEWHVSDSQRDAYRVYFNKAVAQDPSAHGFVTGAVARTLFMRSNLPNPSLAKIWALSDIDADGKLSLEEFMISMHLINVALGGTALPDKLPEGFLAQIRTSATAHAAAPAPASVTLPSYMMTNPHAAPAVDPMQIAQQARLEEERREAERIRHQLMDYLREKSQLIEQLRVMQQRTINIGQQYIQADANYLQQEEAVRETELQIERMKIRGASIREKNSLAQQKADLLHDQKMQFDALLQRRQQQIALEEEAVAKMAQQVQQNQTAIQRQQQDIVALHKQIEDSKKQRVMSQKVDADLLRAKLTHAAVQSPAVNAAASSPSKASVPQILDDFGTKSTDPRPLQPSFFPVNDPFVMSFANEQDDFGKLSCVQQQLPQQTPPPALPPKATPAPAAAVPQPDDDFFTPKLSHSNIVVGADKAEPSTPPQTRYDMSKSSSGFEIAGFSETPVSPDDDFFRAATDASTKTMPMQAFPSDDDFFKAAPSAHPQTQPVFADSSETPVPEPSSDFFTPAPAAQSAQSAQSTNPFPEDDFAHPVAEPSPAASMSHSSSGSSVSSKMKNKSLADLFGGAGDDLFAGAVPAKTATPPVPVAVETPVAEEAPVAASNNNPFGAAPAAEPAAAAATSTTGLDAAQLFGSDDFFTGAPAPKAAASAAVNTEEDDFFSPLSDEGQREGGMGSDLLESGSSATQSGFKAFDEALFD